MATKKASKKASKKGGAKKGSAKKGAAKKSASKSEGTANNGLRTFAKGSTPKDGELVEFTESTLKRGVYNEKEGGVYVNGELRTSLGQWKKVDPNALNESEKNNLQKESNKTRAFNQMDIPDAHRGENLHEQNPELQGAIGRQQRSRAVAEARQPELDKTSFGENAEKIQRGDAEAEEKE